MYDPDFIFIHPVLINDEWWWMGTFPIYFGS